MFPLNTVLFPGVSVPLHVFEDRYRALVHHLLRDRRPGRAAVRLGGDPRGLRGRRPRRAVAVPGRLPAPAHRRSSRTPTAPSTSWRSAASGSGSSASTRPGTFPVGDVDRRCPATRRRGAAEVVERARATFTAYRVALAGIRGDPLRRHAAPDPDVPLLDAGRRRARSRCPSGRRCSRPTTPPSGWSWSPTCCAPSCAR